MSRFPSLVRGALILSLLLVAACSGPEAKKQKFYSKGKALYEKAEYVKARLELKNALQIDPKFAQAYHLLGLMDLKEGNIKGAYGSFAKAVELDPTNKDAQYQLGKILLGAKMLDKAQEKADLILKQDPNYRDGLLLKGALLVSRKQSGEARQFLEGLIARGIKSPDTYLLLANAFWEGGDLKGGEGVVARGLEANPNSVELLQTESAILARAQKIEQAAALLAKICALEPKNPNHALNLAQFDWQAGKQEESLKVVTGLVAIDPASEERRLKAVAFLLQHQRQDEAERLLKEGIARDRKNFNLRFALSEFYLTGPQPERGIAVLKECLSLEKESTPGVIQAKGILAKLYLQQGELDQAVKYVNEVLKESPKNVEARFVKGSIHLQQKEPGKAVAEFRTVVSEKPQFLPGYLKLAEANLMNRQPTLALDNLRSADKLAPGSREVQLAFARYYAVQKDWHSAQESLRKLLAQNPGDLEAKVDLGDLRSASGDLAGAEAVYAEVKRNAPNLPVGYVKCGVLYLKQGNYRRALSEYQKAQQLNPNSWLIANDLAYLWAQTARTPQELERALQLAEKARSQNPNGANVLDTVGWLHYLKGDFPMAVDLLRQVVSKVPDAPEANYHLGMALFKSGKLSEAKEKLAKSLHAPAPFPGREEASRTLARL